VLFLAKLDEPGGIVQPCVELRIGGKCCVEVLAFAQEFLGALGVVPKRRVFGDDIQFLEPDLRLIPVKDTSAGAKGIA
jgi:hypothetical protein